MLSLLDQIVENSGPARVVSENHDTSTINWVAGMTDPGEMIACGAYQELRRLNGESDPVYQARLTELLANMRPDIKLRIMAAGRDAALKRSSLDTSNGRVNVMVAGKLPWHGLGVNVDKATSSAQAIQLAGLDWEVVKTQLGFYSQMNGPGTTEINQEWHKADAWGIVRKDTGKYLGTVGPRYQPIQNVEGFDFLDGVLGEFGARYESAGSLFRGEKVWMLAHLPKQAFVINGGDAIEPYVIFYNCHDGSGAAWCYPTSVRVVCANTFRTAGKDRSKGLSIRHTGNVKDKIKAAQSALGMAVQSFEEFKGAAEVMYHKPMEIKHYANDVLDAVLEVTQAQAIICADVLAASVKVTEANRELERKRIAKQIERRGEILDDILERYESERCGIGSIRGTAWSCFQAVTEHCDHAKVGKQAKDEETRLSRRFESVINGPMDEMKQIAYQKALA